MIPFNIQLAGIRASGWVNEFSFGDLRREACRELVAPALAVRRYTSC